MQTDTLKIKGLKINFELEEFEITGLTEDKLQAITKHVSALNETVCDLTKIVSDLSSKK